MSKFKIKNVKKMKVKNVGCGSRLNSTPDLFEKTFLENVRHVN